jgi:hypothetical protein
MEFIARPTPGGGLNLGSRNTAIFDDFVKKNPNVPWKLSPVLPEVRSSGASTSVR